MLIVTVTNFAEVAIVSRVDGREIRRAREKRGWSQKELARRLRVDPGTVGNWERGDVQAPKNRLGMIQAVLFDEAPSVANVIDMLQSMPDDELLRELLRRAAVRNRRGDDGASLF